MRRREETQALGLKNLPEMEGKHKKKYILCSMYRTCVPEKRSFLIFWRLLYHDKYFFALIASLYLMWKDAINGYFLKSIKKKH